MPSRPTPTPGVGQTSIWTPTEMKSPELADLNIEPDDVITMSRLLAAVSSYMDLPSDYTSVDAYEFAEPGVVNEGLYIPWRDRRRRTAENLFMQVVHPTADFKDISRSPVEMARQAKSTVRDSFKLEDAIVKGGKPKVVDKEGIEVDRDEIDRRVQRGAGHVLEHYVEGLEVRQQGLVERRTGLIALVKELKAPGKAHYKAENLNRHRVTGEQTIREAIEVAAINLDWGSVTVDGLHQAVMYKIYGLPGHNNQRLANFLPWASVSRDWMVARLHALNSALRNCKKELKIYQPYLDAARDAEAAATSDQIPDAQSAE